MAREDQLNITFSDGIFDEIGGLIQAQLLHDTRAMVVYGGNADKQKSCDFSARFPFGDQLQDLSFAG